MIVTSTELIFIKDIDDPSVIADGVIYRSKADGKFKFKENGIIRTLNGGGGGSTDPAGSTAEIQYNDNGSFGASPDLKWNGDYLTLGSLEISKPLTEVIEADQANHVLVEIPNTYRMIYVDYTISRDGETRSGTVTISHNSTASEHIDTGSQTEDTGVELSSAVIDDNVALLYNSTAGNNGEIVFSIRRSR